MKKKVYTYSGETGDVTYDLARCIHAAECVRGLPRAFNPKRKPWVDPEAAEADDLAAAVLRCPTGALKFERADEGAGEETPGMNAVTIDANGPLFVRGDVVMKTPDGEVLLEDTRVALCRCGQSKNKPLCDGSHTKAGFEDAGGLGKTSLSPQPPAEPASESFAIIPALDGPILLRGPFEVRGAFATVYGEKAALCRCGASKNKPFCDGTHREIGFSSED